MIHVIGELKKNLGIRFALAKAVLLSLSFTRSLPFPSLSPHTHARTHARARAHTHTPPHTHTHTHTHTHARARAPHLARCLRSCKYTLRSAPGWARRSVRGSPPSSNTVSGVFICRMNFRNHRFSLSEMLLFSRSNPCKEVDTQ